MPEENELCFVQFIHPGKEHRPDDSGEMKWNRSDHRRKFLEVDGRYMRRGKARLGSIRFWGEWEAASQATSVSEPVKNGPRYIHRPYFQVPKEYRGLQNTDPFVFGGFFYTGCQQHTVVGPTQLRYLERGSVILFGSCVDGKFAVDSVFVVADWIDHDAQNYRKLLKAKVPAAYWAVTLRAWYANNGDEGCANHDEATSYRLYFGATVEKPFDGMFSYVPCKPAVQSLQGFARPAIEIPRIIRVDLLQGKRLNRGVTAEDVKQYWSVVRRQVEEAGLWLGVAAKIPRERSAGK